MMSGDYPVILGTGTVLPDTEAALLEVPEGLGEPRRARRCVPAPGKGVLPSAAVRRLGRTQRLAMTAIHHALEDAGIPIDERDNVAVCVGTAWGELGHTYTFLENMIVQKEENPKPASFVNSVHNAIAGQIGLTLKCKGENHTHIHSSVSFESALWQAVGILNQRRADKVVVCGVDELNPYIVVAEESRRHSVSGEEIIPGEGAAAIVLGRDEGMDNQPRLRAMKFRPWSIERVDARPVGMEMTFIDRVLAEAQLAASDVDLVLCTTTGSHELDNIYERVVGELSKSAGRDIPFGGYHQMAGEYRTVSAVGVALAAQKIKNGTFPEILKLDLVEADNMLVYSLSDTGFQSACVVGR